MSISTTQIKLYGPGINKALERVNSLEESKEWKSKILHSGTYIGETTDYEIGWKAIPTSEEILVFVKYLDEVLTQNKCRYTVTTNTPGTEDIFQQIETTKKKDLALTFIRFIGPSISKAIEALNKEISEFPGVKEVKGELIGKYDYVFEWLRIPEPKDIMVLVDKMDLALKDTGVIYTVATKSKLGIFKAHKIEFLRPPERDLVHLITTRKL
jgi:hypothetical protein